MSTRERWGKSSAVIGDGCDPENESVGIFTHSVPLHTSQSARKDPPNSQTSSTTTNRRKKEKKNT